MVTLSLCYHALSGHWPAVLAVTAGQFERQIERLSSRGYRATNFSDVVRGDAPERAVAITFDDAFASVREQAFPILAEHGMTATVFVPTDYPDSGRPMAWEGLGKWEKRFPEELRCMSWSELRELRDAGWEIGSHTCSHPFLTTLGDDDLRRELSRSRDVCAQEMGEPCHSIAYPYGNVDDRVARAAGAAGYLAAGALGGRFHSGSRLRAPRVGIYRGDTRSRFELKVSPTTVHLRRSRLWDWLEALRERRRKAFD